MIIANDPLANILVMGDLNDNPTDKSISEVLAAISPASTYVASGLYSLLTPRFKNGEGSLYYKSWDMFDQLIVSGIMLNATKGLKCKPVDAIVFKPEWILYKNRDGEMLPTAPPHANTMVDSAIIYLYLESSHFFVDQIKNKSGLRNFQSKPSKF